MSWGFRATFRKEKGRGETTGKRYYFFWVEFHMEDSETDRNTFTTNPIIQEVGRAKISLSAGTIRFIIDRDTAKMDHPGAKWWPNGKGIGQLLDAKAIQLLHQNVKRIRFIQRGPRKMPIDNLMRFYGWKIGRDSFRKNPATKTYPITRIKEVRKKIMQRKRVI